MARGGYRPGAGRKPNPNKPKTIATPKLKAAVPAEPKSESLPAIDPRAWALMLPEIEEISKRYAVNKPRSDTPELNPFQLPAFPKKAMPPEKLQMAMDSNLTFASQQWLAGAELGGLSGEGLLFLGFTFLAELAQRPEYRVISETIADDATRRWIEFDVTGDEKKQAEERQKDPKGFDERMADPDERAKRIEQGGKTDKVKALKDDQLQLEVQQRFYEQARNDGFFGRSHLFLDIRNGADPTDEELKTPIGDGRDEMSKGKVGLGSFKALKTIEPVWTYPLSYNAINPLRYDWYNPQQWFVMGKEIHNSRLRTFIGHPVPDMLKPAYSFGGLSLSQMAKPYVDIWLQTRQSVAQLIHSFSVMVLMTDLSTLMSPNNVGPLLARVAMFNMLRDNQGTFVVNKNTEDFKNVSASLAGLHELQSQAQEHMASVSRIPLVKLTGIQPAGLNASSEGEIKVYDDTIMAYQQRFFRPDLQRVINFEQLSLFGAVDPEITWRFEKLREITAAEKGQKEKDDADRNQKYVDMGALAPGEVRKIIIDDPDLPYTGLDPEDVPDLKMEEEEGLEPNGKENDGGGANDADLPFRATDAKLSKASVQYGEGMGKSRCGRCEHFLKPDACALVEGTISRAGWCDRFEPNKQAADAGWNESDHPRAPDGKFGQGSGSGTASHTPVERHKADQDWEDYGLGRAIKDASRGEKIEAGHATITGETLSEAQAIEVTRAAAILQHEAENGRTKHQVLYRGQVFAEPQTFKRNAIISTDSLTATSGDRSVAEKYHDPQFAGLEEGEGHRVLFRYSGAGPQRGYDRRSDDDFQETILPRGAEYRVGNVSQNNGVTVVDLFQSKDMQKKPIAQDKAPFEESQHPRDPDGQFASSGGAGSSPAFKTKKEHASHLLQKGTTTAEMLKALGWPSISMPQMAKTLGVKLEKVKEGGVTKYKSRPMNKAEQAEFDAAAAAKKAARAAEPKKGRGRAGADPKTWSLFEFLASNGGLKPTADLQSIFGSKRGPFVPGFGPLLRPGGLPMDDALTRAKENSYILDPNDIQHTAGAENRGENTVRWQDLQDMIAEESRGRKQYRNDFAQPETEVDAEEESRHIVDALHREVTASGGTVDPALEERVVQIMQVEGEHDVLAAYERAVMEDHDRYEAALDDRRDAGYEAEGWDVFPDAASGNGEAAPGERR